MRELVFSWTIHGFLKAEKIPILAHATARTNLHTADETDVNTIKETNSVHAK